MDGIDRNGWAPSPEYAAKAQPKLKAAKRGAVVSAVLAALPASREAIHKAVKADPASTDAALRRLVKQGKIREEDGKFAAVPPPRGSTRRTGKRPVPVAGSPASSDTTSQS